MIRVGINGFGRIGRALFRVLSERADMEVVVINDLGTAQQLAHLLKYDSVHGKFHQSIEVQDNVLVLNDKPLDVIQQSDISEIPWAKYEVDIVVECTGKFKTKAELQHHIDNGAKRVILSVPPSNEEIPMVVMGVNDHILTPTDQIVSNASCTTNNAAFLIKGISELTPFRHAYITTIHSFTSDQNIHDNLHTDFRRMRSASQSIIPTTTGAAKAMTRIFPDFSNAIGGCGIRVPVPNGSFTDVTFSVKEDLTVEQINAHFKKISNKYLEYSAEPLVSIDVVGNTHSCIFDSLLTSVVGDMVKVVGWYDNEMGYSNRLKDLILKLSASI